MERPKGNKKEYPEEGGSPSASVRKDNSLESNSEPFRADWRPAGKYIGPCALVETPITRNPAKDVSYLPS
jgi:hypothetical protein